MTHNMVENIRRELMESPRPVEFSEEDWAAARLVLEREFLPPGVSWEQLAAWPETQQAAHIAAWRHLTGRTN